MMAQASARVGGSTCVSLASRPGLPAPKPSLPKQLAANAAVLLGGGALGAAAAQAAAAPYGAAAAVSAPTVQLPDLALPSISLPDVDVAGLLDGADPLLLAGAAAAVAIPAALVALLGGGGGKPKLKGVSAAKALEALAADEYCILLDIRSKAEAKEAGTPNLKGVSRRGAVSVPFTTVVKGEEVVDEAFGSKVAKVKGVEAGGAPVILLDTSGREAAAAARAILAEVDLESLYFVQGGAEAWQAAGGPWKEPGSGFSFTLPDFSALDLSTATKTISGGVQTVQNLAADIDSAPTAKGLLTGAALVGASALLFSQVELLLELAGLVAAGQFVLKVVFAEDREKTLTEIKRVAQEIDVKDLPRDLGKAAATLLEDPTASATQVKKVEVAAPAVEKQAAPAPKPVPVVAASSASSSEAAPAPTPATGEA